jgi:hypothetical protein
LPIRATISVEESAIGHKLGSPLLKRNPFARPERRPQAEVEGRQQQPQKPFVSSEVETRPSTTLGTNGLARR